MSSGERRPPTQPVGKGSHGVQTELTGDYAAMMKQQVAQLIAAKEEELDA